MNLTHIPDDAKTEDEKFQWNAGISNWIIWNGESWTGSHDGTVCHSELVSIAVQILCYESSTHVNCIAQFIPTSNCSKEMVFCCSTVNVEAKAKANTFPDIINPEH